MEFCPSRLKGNTIRRCRVIKLNPIKELWQEHDLKNWPSRWVRASLSTQGRVELTEIHSKIILRDSKFLWSWEQSIIGENFEFIWYDRKMKEIIEVRPTVKTCISFSRHCRMKLWSSQSLSWKNYLVVICQSPRRNVIPSDFSGNPSCFSCDGTRGMGHNHIYRT